MTELTQIGCKALYFYIYLAQKTECGKKPFVCPARKVAEDIKLSYKEVRNVIKILMEKGIVKEADEQTRAQLRAQLRAQPRAQLGAQPLMITLNCKSDIYTFLKNMWGATKGATEGATKGATEGATKKENSEKLSVKKNTPIKSAKTTLIATFEQRKERFADTLRPYLDMYGKDMLNEFYRYWTEANASRTKMRFEQQPTWEVNLRLANWARRNNVYPHNNANNNASQKDYERNQRQQGYAKVIEDLLEEGERKMQQHQGNNAQIQS